MNRRNACWILREKVEGLRLAGGAAAVGAAHRMLGNVKVDL